MNRRRAETAAAWVAAVPFAVWALIRLFGLDGGFPLEAMMPFTPYVAVAALAAAALGLALRNWAPAVLAVLAALALGAVVLPRQFGDETVSGEGQQTVSVLAANVHRGHAYPDGLVNLVNELRPVVLTVEEFTPRFGRELSAAGIDRLLPHHVLDAAKSSSGTAIYSRFPLRRLPTASDNLFKMARAEMTLPRGRRLKIVAVHPYPPMQRSVTGEWEDVLADLPSGGQGTPWLLAGDFNATFDQAPFRELVDRGYRDAGETAGKGLDATFPADGSLFPPPITIDHILADERFGIVEYEVEPLPNSDHHAIFAKLALPVRGVPSIATAEREAGRVASAWAVAMGRLDFEEACALEFTDRRGRPYRGKTEAEKKRECETEWRQARPEGSYGRYYHGGHGEMETVKRWYGLGAAEPESAEIAGETAVVELRDPATDQHREIRMVEEEGRWLVSEEDVEHRYGG